MRANLAESTSSRVRFEPVTSPALSLDIHVEVC